MVRHHALIAGMVGALLCSGVTVSTVSAADSAGPVRQAVGEIIWLDTQLGRLQLYTDHSPGTRATAQYSITQQDTRVTDRADSQFLAIADLRAGQQVTVESRASGEEQLATKIIVEPTAAPVFQQAEGTIESIDASTPGTLTLRESTSTPAAGTVTLFAFDPQTIVVMESPSLEPVRLAVQPGDFVKVAYEVEDGKRYARSMMRYAGPATAPAIITPVTPVSRTPQPSRGVLSTTVHALGEVISWPFRLVGALVRAIF